MKLRVLVAPFMAVLSVSAAMPGSIRAQAAPSAPPAGAFDLRPYVKVMCDCSRERYRLVTKNGQQTVGPQIDSDRGIMGLGSGTVISRDGLILTNDHVAKAVLSESRQIDGDVLTRIIPQRIVIATIDPAHPYLPPKPRYIAQKLALYEERDMAILKIDRELATDAQVRNPNFPFEALGNPYDMVPGRDEVTAVGYPAKGGASVTVSKGLLMGYQFEGRAPDGSLNSSVTIGPGNSGGAALFGGHLVAVPTAVSTDVGSDFGYLNPITWAARPLAYVAMRYGQPIPVLDSTWVRNEYNPDIASRTSFIGGRVKDAATTVGVPDAVILIRRPDRTRDQIVKLDNEVGIVVLAAQVQRALKEGATVEELAQRAKLTVDDVKELAGTRIDPRSLSADARAMLGGEFFYSTTTTEKDGFFFVEAPRGRQLTLTVEAQGYRNGGLTLNVRNESYSNVGALKLSRP